MRAVIMAGGEGRRLRPLSILRPKPMVSLFDKPVMEHILELLKQNGITEICVTLRYLPKTVTDYFGDGARFGMVIEYRVEDEPLGTAGGVKACADFLGNEDFLIISGDAVCSFDLTKCCDFHFEKRSPATIILYETDEPLEYGLVLTDRDSKVTQFIEKPSLDRVYTNAVNTGIYILSPDILKHIPDGVSYDFGRDLFPSLLASGVPIYAYCAEGYWCDIGSSKAYLNSIFDTLEGKTGLNIGKAAEKGLWSYSPLPESLDVRPPCYIGEDVSFGESAELGPFAIIGRGSHIGSGVKIENSLVDGADIGSMSELSGAIVCRGAVVGGECVLSEDCIVGDNAAIGSGSYIAGGVLIWPDKRIEAGSRVLDSIIRGSARTSAALFRGKLSGELGTELSFENLIDAGSAMSRFKKIVLLSNGTAAAQAAENALKCGICAGGAEVWNSETGFESAAAFAAKHYGMGGAIFVRSGGSKLTLSFFGANGRPVTRLDERAIEAALGGDVVRASPDRIGLIKRLPDTLDSYSLMAVKEAFFRDKGPMRTPVGVDGDSIAALTLRRTLSVLGCPTAKSKSDGICFRISDDGFFLLAEYGRDMASPLQIDVMLALLEFELGIGRIALMPAAPAAIELLAQSYGGGAYRLGRDREAEQLIERQRFVFDGIFAAARLMAGLAAREETLSSLLRRIPRFFISQRYVQIEASQGAVMRALTGGISEFPSESGEGVDIASGKGKIHISPRSSRELRISAEAENAEAARELCAEFESIIKKIGGRS